MSRSITGVSVWVSYLHGRIYDWLWLTTSNCNSYRCDRSVRHSLGGEGVTLTSTKNVACWEKMLFRPPSPVVPAKHSDVAVLVPCFTWFGLWLSVTRLLHLFSISLSMERRLLALFLLRAFQCTQSYLRSAFSFSLFKLIYQQLVKLSILRSSNLSLK